MELDIELLDDGGVELKQGEVDCYDVSVILHPCHLDVLASLTGFVRTDEVARACERMQDRLDLLIGLVEAHTQPGDPLRAAAAVLAGKQQPKQLHGTTNLVDGGGVIPHASSHQCNAWPSAQTPNNEPHEKQTAQAGSLENLSLNF